MNQPEVALVNYFRSPYDNVVATARTCYSSKVIYPEDVSATEESKNLRDKIFKSIFEAGHHTTMQHPTFQFILKNVSRHFLWSFLHSHPFYNSEQVSQRYVPVKKDSFYVPPIDGGALGVYMDTVKLQMDAYNKLRELIYEDTKREYLRIYPARSAAFEEKWRSSVNKKVLEIARYVLPVATFAHLYHTVSGITLYRYHRLCESFDTPAECKVVIGMMVDEVRKIDPDFFRHIGDTVPLDETVEYQYLKALSGRQKAGSYKEFDKELGGRVSKLVDYTANTTDMICRAFRLTFGLDGGEISDESCIELLLNPANNRYLSERLNVLSISKASRALNHAYFTFMKKISHTADSQDQRHRMVPATRPILAARLTAGAPDYITPGMIAQNAEALDFYNSIMSKIWDSINKLLDLGISWEHAQYLLPNAVSIRMYESGSLLYLHHKWTTRLCYLAQEEIWKSCLEEAQQVAQVFPEIGKYIHAPCYLRSLANRAPFCPEGSRFCGVRVWELGLEDFKRKI